MQNLLLEIPYKFKKSYGGTPEPQTPQDAPWLRGPSLKIQPAAPSKSIYIVNSLLKSANRSESSDFARSVKMDMYRHSG